jgi:4-alpha-glucanotransferase
MPSTHDLVPTAGWWAGQDIEVRSKIAGLMSEDEVAAERNARIEGRHFLWGALRHAGVAEGDEPAPEATAAVADAAARFVAATPCALAILPLEEALGVLDQPNVPGTVDEHPNWRRRLAGDASALLDAPEAAPRLQAMSARRGRR